MSITNCRLCGLELPCEQSIDIFSRPDGANIPILQYKIKQLLDIAVGQCDNLPHSVCLPCESKLESLWCFRNKCHQMQIQLRKMCKTSSSIIRSTHHEKESYPLEPSSSADLLGNKELGNSRKYSDEISNQESTPTNFDSATLAYATASGSNSIETNFINTRGVDNCISDGDDDDDDDDDYKPDIEEEDSSSIDSEGCSIESSYDPTSHTSSMNEPISNNCKDVEMNISSITKGTDDNPSCTADEQNDKNSTEISPSCASISTKIARSFEGHYYIMETDMNSDLLCNRIPYLLVESKMGTKHNIYTVTPDVSKFDKNHDFLLDSGDRGLYLTLQTYDYKNPNVVRVLIQWVNKLLNGEMSLMPYYFRWLDHKNQPILGFKCVICKHLFNRNRQIVMNHIADHLLWTCPVCGRFFGEITKLRNHFLQHDSVTLECSTCNKKFDSDFEKYKVHKRSYYKFECSSCSFKCSDEDKWLMHLKKDREKCCSSDCGSFYETIDEFQKHVSKVSTVGGYVCGACGMAYHCEEYLKLHLGVHGLEHGSKTRPTSACNSADEVSKKIDVIINSNEDVHFDMMKKVLDNEIDVNNFRVSSMKAGGKVYTGFKCFKFGRCNVVASEKKFRIHIGNHFMMTCLCKKMFRDLKRFKDHFKQHSFKGRMCVQCKKDVWLDTSAEYFEHLSLHKKRRICVYCQSVFPTMKALEAHVRHHEIEVGSHRKYTSKFENDNSRERHPKKMERIVCDTCGKNYDKKHLRVHMQKMHNKKNDIFICAYCSKEFSNRYGFILHIRRHMNEKNFKCDICDKAFNRQSSLKKHTLDMHSERKHVCECGRRFTYPSALRDHMKRAHALVIN